MASPYSLFQVGTATVALHEMPFAKSVCIGVWFKAGGRYEPEELHGGAHFIEHMLFKGTHRRSAFRINQEIESKGGDLNAFTSEELSCYYCRISSDHYRLALDILLDMVFHSTFTSKEMERERGVIQEEIRMYEDQPSSVATDYLNAVLWPSQPLGRILTGTVETVGKMRRADLLGFWRGHYYPGNAIIAVSGCVDKKELTQELQKHLGKKHPSVLSSKKVTRARAISGRNMKKVYLKRNFQQVNVAIGAAAYSRHEKKRYALRILSVLLGENSCSRLFQTLRERKGLVYSVSTSIAQFQDTGAFYIQAGLDADNYASAARLIHKELQMIQSKMISPSELKRAKDFAIGQLHLNLESSMHQVMCMGEGVAGYGYIPDSEEWRREILKVTSSDVQKVAREIFAPGRMAVVGVGDGLDEGQFLREKLV